MFLPQNRRPHILAPQQIMAFSIPGASGGTQRSHPPPPGGPKPLSLGHGGACATCRARKVRCDAARPVCKPCTTSHRECVYVTVRKNQGPTPVVVLGTRLAELQRRYAELLSQTLKPADQRLESSVGGEDQAPVEPQELSKMDRDIILEVFFHEQNRTFCYENREDFFKALQHPSESQRPHPGLLDAMVLLGSALIRLPDHQTVDTAALLERIPQAEFLAARIHSGITDSLAHHDRLRDIFNATSLLCHWLFYRGRFQEAQYLCASMARLIIGAKLHQIDATFLEGISNDLLAGDSSTLWDDTLLGRPRDLREVGSRILVFWQSYLTDKLISTVTGLPSAYDESEEARITTVWPRSLLEYDTGSAFQDKDFESISELLSTGNAKGLTGHGNRHRDTLCAMISQAITFLDCTGRLSVATQATPEISLSPGVHSTLIRLHAAISDMTARIPLYATSEKPRETITNEFKNGTSGKLYYLSYVWFMLYVSEIQICRSLEVHYTLVGDHTSASSDRSSHYHNLAVEKARKAVGFVRFLCQQTQFTRDPISLITGFFLTAVAITLGSELRTLEERLQAIVGSHGEEASSSSTLQAWLNDLESDFTAVRQFIETMSQRYPILGFQLTKLDEARMGC